MPYTGWNMPLIVLDDNQCRRPFYRLDLLCMPEVCPNVEKSLLRQAVDSILERYLVSNFPLNLQTGPNFLHWQLFFRTIPLIENP